MFNSLFLDKKQSQGPGAMMVLNLLWPQRKGVPNHLQIEFSHGCLANNDTSQHLPPCQLSGKPGPKVHCATASMVVVAGRVPKLCVKARFPPAQMGLPAFDVSPGKSLSFLEESGFIQLGLLTNPHCCSYIFI